VDVRWILSRELPAARGLTFLTVDDQWAVQRQLEALRLCSHGSLPREQDVSASYLGGENRRRILADPEYKGSWLSCARCTTRDTVCSSKNQGIRVAAGDTVTVRTLFAERVMPALPA